jgi:hypothetical protein
MCIVFSGGTCSNAVVIGADGVILGRATGEGTNNYVRERVTIFSVADIIW